MHLGFSDIGDVFYWTGPNGSRCGIVNVNAGTSGKSEVCAVPVWMGMTDVIKYL